MFKRLQKEILYKKDVSIDYFRLTLIREHTRHALKPRKSLGIDSIIFFNNYFPEKYRMLDSDSIQNFKVRKTSVKLKLVIIVANTKKRDDSEVIAFFYFFFSKILDKSAFYRKLSIITYYFI